MKPHVIRTDRFLEFYKISDTGIEWNEDSVTIEDVRDGIANGMTEQHKAYVPYAFPVNKEWHIGRIIYFINRPDKITPLDIEGDIDEWEDHKNTWVALIDGHHRFAAILYLGLSEFRVRYSGSVDVLRYLTGETNIYK